MRPAGPRNGKVLLGCRLLDYARRETHRAIPHGPYLLGLRAGLRYDPAVGHRGTFEELLLIFYTLRKMPSLASAPFENARALEAPPEHASEMASNMASNEGGPKVWPLLRSRLKLPPTVSMVEAEQHLHVSSILKSRLCVWVECVTAPTLKAALDVMRKNPFAQWPAPVVLHTYARHCSSAQEALEALHVLQRILPLLPTDIQAEAVYLCLQILQRHLVDLIPDLIELLLTCRRTSGRELGSSLANELLWRLADYGFALDAVDIPPVQNAQSLIVREVGVTNLDAKGFFGLCYVEFKRERSAASTSTSASSSASAGASSQEHEPENESNQPLELMESHAHLVPPGCRDFAYIAGPHVLRILSSKSVSEVLALASSMPIEHRAQLWSCCARHLDQLGELSEPLALRIFHQAVSESFLNANLVCVLISVLPRFEQRLRCIEQAREHGLKLTDYLVSACCSRLTRALDIEACERHFKRHLSSSKKVFVAFLQSVLATTPERFWDLYVPWSEHNEPPRSLLTSMCIAAQNTQLVWGGLFAAQRATVEIKKFVRGVASPSSDVTLQFPNERLLHAYVVMLGKAGYHQELAECLRWSQQLELKLSKRVLLAIVHFSPHGAGLLRIGRTLEGWPTEKEYMEYCGQLK